ncbi:MAG: exopolysaccharide biosynthesis polyprenyl glycosylphosphotransferase, partial [Bacteroidota bacterium]
LIGVTGIFLYFQLLDQPIDFIFYSSIGYFLLVNSINNSIFKTYDIPVASSADKLNLVLFVYVVTFSIYFLTPTISPKIPENQLTVLYLVAFMPIAVTLWRFFYIAIIHQPVLYTNILIFGRTNCIAFIKQHFDFEGHAYRVLGEKATDEGSEIDDNTFAALKKLVDKQSVNTVILAYNNLGNIPGNVNEFVEYCSVKGVEIYNHLKFYESVNYAIPIRELGNNLYLSFPFTRTNYNLIYKGLHRILDVFSSVVGLLFLGIIIPPVVILNVFFNPGPLFFEQLRVGKGGIEIPILKLRSMVVDAEKKTGAIMAQKNDARVTQFGKILRKFRFDELPQFWAVLKGDMSLIGPRPERKVFVDQLKGKIPAYDMRHMIKPGITGWAQVKYKYGENLEDSYRKLEYDLYYIKNRSILMDIRIIVDTINTVIFSRGQ